MLVERTRIGADAFGDIAAALVSDSDSRLHLDPVSGLNKYFCPVEPRPHIVCGSSCTASPISPGGFDAAMAVFNEFLDASPLRTRGLLLREQAQRIERYLLGYFGADGLAHAFLCSSGTDGLLLAARLVAAESPDGPMTAILPSAAETGTGVPLAAAGRVFDGPCTGQATTSSEFDTVEVALRAIDGSPLPNDALDAAFADAVSRVRGRAVIYLTHGSKTGLIAPCSPPDGADVIVDACQARIDPARVAGYLRQGWPVVVSGSKFLGGPAFSGAVLFPVGRPRYVRPRPPELGTVLRWTAAVDSMQRFGPVSQRAASFLKQRVAAIDAAIAANPALVPVAGLSLPANHWADRPSIVTFAIRDVAERRRLLTAKALRPIYEELAGRGILLGQPVDLGLFGGLRIAIGARDVVEGLPVGQDRLLDAISVLGRPAVALAAE
jgi:hypothetical protein